MTSHQVTNSKVSTPKRGNTRPNNRSLWYDYYAGYSPQFVSNIISHLDISEQSTILDPWNGIGTTTLAASAAGFRARGLDLNPVPVIISKALSLSLGEKQSILPLTQEIISKALHKRSFHQIDEPLRIWFGVNASKVIRNIERSIQACLVRTKQSEYSFIKFDVSIISEISAFFYLALFRTVKKLTQKFTGTNPTWIKKPKHESDKVEYTTHFIRKSFEEEVQFMLASFDPLFASNLLGDIRVDVGNSTNISCNTGTIDAIISSPPYCTRIDYAVCTMPELSLLGFADKNFDELRRGLIGSTKVPAIQTDIEPIWGTECNNFLNNLNRHSSKASSTYYLKNHIQYFDLIFKSISEIGRVLKNKANCVLVVQDSYYKEIHNDLPTMITEMAENANLALVNKLNFSAPNNIAKTNPKSKKYRQSTPATEKVLFFQKSAN
jgi:DNA modification methylase